MSNSQHMDVCECPGCEDSDNQLLSWVTDRNDLWKGGIMCGECGHRWSLTAQEVMDWYKEVKDGDR